MILKYTYGHILGFNFTLSELGPNFGSGSDSPKFGLGLWIYAYRLPGLTLDAIPVRWVHQWPSFRDSDKLISNILTLHTLLIHRLQRINTLKILSMLKMHLLLKIILFASLALSHRNGRSGSPNRENRDHSLRRSLMYIPYRRIVRRNGVPEMIYGRPDRSNDRNSLLSKRFSSYYYPDITFEQAWKRSYDIPSRGSHETIRQQP